MGLLKSIAKIAAPVVGFMVGGPAGAAAGATLSAGASASSAAQKAAAQQAAGAQDALALQREMFERQMALQQPYMQGGVTAQNELMRLLGVSGDAASAGYGSLAQPFGMQQFQADPGYAFRMSEGLKAMDRAAAARGGLISGAALKAGQRYGQEMGSQEYQNAFNRYQTEREARMNPLLALAGRGQGAAGTAGGAASEFGRAGGQTLQDIGTIRSSGTVGSANALAGIYGGLGNVLGGMSPTRGSAYGIGATGGGGFAGMPTLAGATGNQLGDYLNQYYGR